MLDSHIANPYQGYNCSSPPNVLAGTALDHPIIYRVEILLWQILRFLIVKVETPHQNERHAKQQIETRLQLTLFHEISLTRKQVKLTNLLLQHLVVTIRVIQLLQGLHHLGLQR